MNKSSNQLVSWSLTAVQKSVQSRQPVHSSVLPSVCQSVTLSVCQSHRQMASHLLRQSQTETDSHIQIVSHLVSHRYEETDRQIDSQSH